jgi:hypothetical protein
MGAASFFVSYRREDHAPAGRVYDRLADYFGEEQLFFDVEGITPGEDFSEVIEGAAGSCKVMVAIMGRQWLGVREDGTRRIDSAIDFVHREIAIALDKGIRVIPVLVDGATVLEEEHLPPPLRRVAMLQAIRIDHASFKTDVRRLIQELERNSGLGPVAPEDSRRHLNARLDRFLAEPPLEVSPDFASMYLIAAPTGLREELLGTRADPVKTWIREAIEGASKWDVFQYRFEPSFSNGSMRSVENGWRVYLCGEPDKARPRDHRYALDLEVNFDGSAQLFLGRAAQKSREVLHVFDEGIAATAVRFLYFVGKLYKNAQYSGPCELGVVLTGLKDGVAFAQTNSLRPFFRPYERSVYRSAVSTNDEELFSSSKDVARRLLRGFFHELLGEWFDPFEQK